MPFQTTSIQCWKYKRYKGIEIYLERTYDFQWVSVAIYIYHLKQQQLEYIKWDLCTQIVILNQLACECNAVRVTLYFLAALNNE